MASIGPTIARTANTRSAPRSLTKTSEHRDQDPEPGQASLLDRRRRWLPAGGDRGGPGHRGRRRRAERRRSRGGAGGRRRCRCGRRRRGRSRARPTGLTGVGFAAGRVARIRADSPGSPMSCEGTQGSGSVPLAFPRNRDRSTTTRVIRPAATSPSRCFTETRNVSRRPSTDSSTASASTSSPTGTGARWSSWTRYPTVVLSAAICPAIAATVARSASSTTRGVASTGTSPLPSASAVSLSQTVSAADPTSPGSRGTGVPYAPRAVGGTSEVRRDRRVRPATHAAPGPGAGR